MEGNSRDRYMQIANSSFHSHAHGQTSKYMLELRKSWSLKTNEEWNSQPAHIMSTVVYNIMMA